MKQTCISSFLGEKDERGKQRESDTSVSAAEIYDYQVCAFWCSKSEMNPLPKYKNIQGLATFIFSCSDVNVTLGRYHILRGLVALELFLLLQNIVRAILMTMCMLFFVPA